MPNDRRYALLVLVVILGSFLSFTSEPMIGRLLVPFFGGAVHVWTVCMTVFQALLLIGYAYAHVVATRIGAWHIAVMAVALPWLPLALTAEVDAGAPLSALVGALLGHIALPFWTLTTTAVVVQHWFARSSLSDHRDPYTLYAASNIGSLVGLLGYPFLIEPWLTLTNQRLIWSAGWLLWWALLGATWIALRDGMRDAVPIEADGREPTARDAVVWLFLSAVPSALLLAITQLIASDMGSFPLVWVLPLGLYLGSFILAFREKDQSWLFQYWPDCCLALLLFGFASVPVFLLPVVLAVFFVSCWLVHAQLFALRPPPHWLTRFYLVVSAGGWCGGLVMSLAVPYIFDHLIDVSLTALALTAVMYFVTGLPERTWFDRAPRPLALLRSAVGALLVGGLVGSVAVLGSREVLETHRNFYGVFEIREITGRDGETARLMAHGATIHGVQYVEGAKWSYPPSYYHEGGPLHEALAGRVDPGDIGAIGLGAGAVAYWLKEGQNMVFYEIDPDNERLAREWFTYLENSPGEVSVRVGDARLLLASEDDRTRYSVLFLDAFSGDSIPLHLLTEEAFETYLSRIIDGGSIVIHLSNRYYDLRGVVNRLAEHFDLYAAWRVGSNREVVSKDPLLQGSIAMILSREPASIDKLVASGWTRAVPGKPYRAALWTDDYANILVPLYQRMINGFTP